MKNALEISNLTVSYENLGKCALEIEDLRLPRETILAVVGESGSGKTTLARAISGVFPYGSSPELKGSILFEGVDLVTCSTEQLREICRTKIRHIFQDPQHALNPVLSVGKQLNLSATQRTSEGELLAALDSVGLRDGNVLERYPHELSVGMAQRVMIAMALLAQPSLLIADEPTSAVDAAQRYQILDLLVSLVQRFGFAILLVTHDVELARRYASHVAVLSHGRIVEYAATADFFTNPRHPYSKLLLASMPDLRTATQSHRSPDAS